MNKIPTDIPTDWIKKNWESVKVVVKESTDALARAISITEVEKIPEVISNFEIDLAEKLFKIKQLIEGDSGFENPENNLSEGLVCSPEERARASERLKNNR